MKRLFFLLVAFVLVFTSCTKEPYNNLAEGQSSSITIDVKGSSQSVKFTTNYPWSAVCESAPFRRWKRVSFVERGTVTDTYRPVFVPGLTH